MLGTRPGGRQVPQGPLGEPLRDPLNRTGSAAFPPRSPSVSSPMAGLLAGPLPAAPAGPPSSSPPCLSPTGALALFPHCYPLSALFCATPGANPLAPCSVDRQGEAGEPAASCSSAGVPLPALRHTHSAGHSSPPRLQSRTSHRVSSADSIRQQGRETGHGSQQATAMIAMRLPLVSADNTAPLGGSTPSLGCSRAQLHAGSSTIHKLMAISPDGCA